MKALALHLFLIMLKEVKKTIATAYKEGDFILILLFIVWGTACQFNDVKSMQIDYCARRKSTMDRDDDRIEMEDTVNMFSKSP